MTEGDVWVTNRKRVVLFLVVLGTSLVLPYFRKLNDMMPNVHPVWCALLAGIITTVVTYLPVVYADSKYGFSSAVLLGLLVAEFAVYGAPIGFPSPIMISFMLYMFYIGESEAEHLFPEKKKSS